MRRPALAVYRVGPRSPFLVSGNSKSSSCRCLPSGGLSRKAGGRKPPRGGAPSSGECPFVAKNLFARPCFKGRPVDGCHGGRPCFVLPEAPRRRAGSASVLCGEYSSTCRRVLECFAASTIQRPARRCPNFRYISGMLKLETDGTGERKTKAGRKRRCFLPAGSCCRSSPAFYLMLPTFIRYSAICTAFSAAPFLIWSPTSQRVMPFSLARSLRMRPT